jgi:hypothetical protein
LTGILDACQTVGQDSYKNDTIYNDNMLKGKKKRGPTRILHQHNLLSVG